MKRIPTLKKYGQIYIAIFLVLTVSQSCSNNDLMVDLPEDDQEFVDPSIRGFFNSEPFVWEKVMEVAINGGTQHISLPWIEGNTHAQAIPDSWIDPNALSNDEAERMYSRKNGWELVYSNLNYTTMSNKYFALYNRYTGMMRFFYYSMGTNTGSSGSNSTFIGINVNKPTSLFNFTTDIPTPISDRKQAPAYCYAPKIANVDGTPNELGFSVNQWYGMEIECAYDPQLPSEAAFKSQIWAALLTQTEGSILTTGRITGEIRSTNSNKPTLSLNFGDSHSNSEKTYYYTNKESVSEVLGTEIETNINKGSAFHTKLWKDIKSNASKWITSGLEAGVKQGLKAIVSSGGSVVADALGGAMNSLLGGSKDNIMKVDLGLEAESVVNLTSTTRIDQWAISALPVPGARASGEIPLYNQPLGVWNIQEAPKVKVDGTVYWGANMANTYSFNSYTLQPVNIVLNPAVAAECNIKNLTYHMLFPTRLTTASPTFYKGELVNMEPHYNVGRSHTGDQMPGPAGGVISAFRGYVRVKFDLVSKSTGATVATFSKVFAPQTVIGQKYEFREPIGPIRPGLD